MNIPEKLKYTINWLHHFILSNKYTQNSPFANLIAYQQNQMGNAYYTEASSDPEDKYAKCVSIDQVPPIELTYRRIDVIISNALESIIYLKSIMHVIDNYHSRFNIQMVCKLIKLNDVNLFNRLYNKNKKYISDLIKYSPDNDNIVHIYMTSIESNKSVLKWLITNFKILYNYLDDSDRYDKFMQIFLCFGQSKLEEELITFIDANNKCLKSEYHVYICGMSRWGNFIMKRMESAASHQHLDALYAKLKCSLTELDKSDIYEYACKYKYPKISIECIQSDIKDRNDVLYIACKNNLEEVAKKIVISHTSKLTIVHFTYSPNDIFENNTMMHIINNDMISIFRIIIKTFFVNTGKVKPEDCKSDFGRYLVYCHIKNKTEFKQVLLENIVFANDLTDFINKPAVEPTKAKTTKKTKPKIEIKELYDGSVELHDFETGLVKNIKEIVNRDEFAFA
jgi:hypothetical protein